MQDMKIENDMLRNRKTGNTSSKLTSSGIIKLLKHLLIIQAEFNKNASLSLASV